MAKKAEKSILQNVLTRMGSFAVLVALMGTALAETAAKSEADYSPLSRIVFVTTSMGCDCTMKRCKDSEEAVKAALAGHPGAPALEKIDHATEKEKASAILEKYPAMMLPVLYFLDKDGALLGKLEGEIKKEQVAEILDKHKQGK